MPHSLALLSVEVLQGGPRSWICNLFTWRVPCDIPRNWFWNEAYLLPAVHLICQAMKSCLRHSPALHFSHVLPYAVSPQHLSTIVVSFQIPSGIQARVGDAGSTLGCLGNLVRNVCCVYQLPLSCVAKSLLKHFWGTACCTETKRQGCGLYIPFPNLVFVVVVAKLIKFHHMSFLQHVLQQRYCRLGLSHSPLYNVLNDP